MKLHHKHLMVLVVCILLICLAPYVGASPPSDPAVREFVFWQLRIPRVVVGCLVGGTLGIVGAAFQCVFSNPLATPSTTGTTAGATLGALFAMILFPSLSNWGLTLFAFIGGLVVAIPVAALAVRRQSRIEDVLLAGIAFSIAAGAITTGLQFRADQVTTYRAVQWSLGSLSQNGYEELSVLLPFCGVCIVAVLTQIRSLEVLVGGEVKAFSQGVSVVAVRTWILVFGSLGVAGCVASCGPIAFVGLVVPHIVRLTMGNIRRYLIPFSAVVGAGFLAVSDALARIMPTELPVGVVTASLGAPLLIFLVLRRT